MSEVDRSVPDAFDLVHSFVTASLQGELTESEIVDFEALLQADAHLQQVYTRYLGVTVQIPRMLARAEWGTPSPGAALPIPPAGDSGQSAPPGLGSQLWQFLGDHGTGVLLTALLVVGVGGVLAGRSLFPARQTEVARPALEPGGTPAGVSGLRASAAAASPAVARLVRVHECRWRAPGPAPAAGDALVAGQKLDLRSGLVEIAFARGAQVVLEGPAALTVMSDNSANLDVGRLSAIAPQSAIGFTVNTPWTRLVDLGTEFGVEVDSAGLGAAHVFRGEVALDPPESHQGRQDAAATAASPGDRGEARALFASPSSVFLRENQSLSVKKPAANGAEVVVRGAARPAEFVRPQQLTEKIKAAENDASPLGRWQRFRADLSRRGDLVAYYDFQRDDAAPAVLCNRAGTGRALDGRILPGTQWSEGRFPAKQSLTMIRPGSGVHVDIPGEFRQMTLLAWVKVGRLSKVLNGLVMSDGEKMPDCFRWQIRREGRVFAYCGSDWNPSSPQDGVLGSDPAFTTACFGRWCLLGVVRDQRAGTQRFYLDAEPVGQRAVEPDAPPARLGPLTIGGWDPRDFRDKEGNQDRALEGCVDELMIFNAALSPEAIRRVYEQGAAPAANPGKTVNTYSQGLVPLSKP